MRLDRAQHRAEKPVNRVYCGAACLCETSMKTGLNRPGILQVPLRVLPSALPAMVFDELPVTGCHTGKLIELP